MKKTGKHLLVLGLLLIGVVGLVACDRTKPKPTPKEETLNVLSGFSGDTAYTFSKNDESELAFDYEKGEDEDVSITKNVTGLKKYKKLLINVNGSGEFSLILENSQDETSKQVSLYAANFLVEYEWDLRNDEAFLEKVDKIRIIAAPGKKDETGNISITKLTFSDQLADNYVIQTDFSNIPSNINEYDGVSENFHFNQKWTNNEDNTNEKPIYTFKYEDDVTVVDYDKSGGFEWSFFYALVKGDFSKFNYFVFKVQGTSGTKVLAKYEPNNVEESIILDGSVQEFAIDFSTLTASEKNKISRILIFGAAGTPSAKGSFKIVDAYMTESYEIVDEKVYNKYNGTDETFVLADWADNGDGVYQVEKLADHEKITYQKGETSHDWSAAAVYIEDSDLSKFGQIVFEIKGPKDKTALLKFEAEGKNVEMPVTFSGEVEEFTVSLKDFTEEQLKNAKMVLIFAEQGKSANVAGEILVYSVYFAEAKEELQDINNNYKSNDEGAYTFTETEEGIKVDKELPNEWTFFYRDVTTIEAEGMNTLVMTFKGTAGDKVLVKPNDNGAYEVWVTLDNDGFGRYEKYISDPITKILVFLNPEVAEVSNVVITSSGLKYTEPPLTLPDELVHEVTVEELIDSGDNVYTITKEDGYIKVDYVKEGHGWATMHVDLATYPELEVYNYIEVILRGTPEKQVLVKVNGQEIWVTFDAEGLGRAEFRKDSLKEILLFAEGGVDNATGSFDILNISLEYRYDFKADAKKSMDGYELGFDSEDNLTVTYTDVKGWMAQTINFPEVAHKFNVFDIQVKTEPGVKIMFKLNDAEEIVLTADEDGIINLEKVMPSTTELVFFVNPEGETGISGILTFTKTILRYQSPTVNEPIFLNDGYVSNDEAVYTFAETEEGIKVTYEKGVGHEWAHFYRLVTESEATGRNTLKITFQGLAGTEIIVKPNDNNAYEESVTLDENGDGVYEKTIDSLVNKIVFFIAPNNTGTEAEPLNGEVTITSVEYKYV